MQVVQQGDTGVTYLGGMGPHTTSRKLSQTVPLSYRFLASALARECFICATQNSASHQTLNWWHPLITIQHDACRLSRVNADACLSSAGPMC